MQPVTVAIIQARYESSRLPAKVLLDIGGKPMLARVVERARRARLVHNVVVATSTESADDLVVAMCADRGYPCYRGSLYDVLARFYGAAKAYQAQVIVRLTADCPVIDPNVIDETLHVFFHQPLESDLYSVAYPGGALAGPCDFAASRLPPPWRRTFPIGQDVEICSFHALERAWHEAHQPYHREHVMPYLYEEESRFRIGLLDSRKDHGSLRWTVDTPEDLELLRQIYARFTPREDFTWWDILALFEREPELAQINAQVRPKVFSEVDQRRSP